MEKVIPILLRRLKEEKSDRVRFRLVEVFYRMHMEYCSLKDQVEVIKAIRAIISEMEDTSHQSLFELSFEAILGQPGAGASC